VIYDAPPANSSIDQGDIIDRCPVFPVVAFDSTTGQRQNVEFEPQRVIVLTQTCDLASEKTTVASVAEVFEAQFLVDQRTLNPTDIKGPIRAGRVCGWYFLPADV
jgi:hypothetical protein